ncbi:MAG: hypothetical protein SXA11_25225 [Cyanobacteriota bacterium]|nr:hypothetical protein [Cyanobacteriota bacterium]
MENSSILNEVVEQLEGDINRSRIKKILFCATRGKWENDTRKIEEYDLRGLISELWENNSSLEVVDDLLARIVSKVNKKTEYGLVANKIIENIAKLYANEQEVTTMETTISNLWDSPVATQLDEPLNDAEEEEVYNERDPGELFEVRQKIMQNSNPLKAKILIFSAVERTFNFSDRDWLNLKIRTLDNLLRQLFNVCTNLTDLESQLYSAASFLEDPDENTQIASTIIEAFKRCYESAGPQVLEEKKAPVSADSSPEAIAPDKEYPEGGTTFNEFEESEENIEDDASFDGGEITLINDERSTSYNAESERNLSSLGFTNYREATDSTVRQVEENEEDEEDEDSEETIISQAKSFDFEPVERKQNQEIPVRNSIYRREAKASESKNILETIKQKLSLQDEVKALVDNGVNAMTKSMEEEFSKLENMLESSLGGEEEEKHLSVKYRALGTFISKTIEMSSKFQKILSQLEKEERNKRDLSKGEDALEASLNKTEISTGTQQKIIELAKQGNPKAIASILNQEIKPTGVSTIAGWKGDILHIILESDQVPNQQSFAPFVEQKIISLKSESLKNVKIHGRQSGNKSVAWTKVVQY